MRSRKGISKDLVAALLARLEPSLRFRFSLIALGRSKTKKWPRDFVRPRPAIRREASPIAEDSSNSPRDFVRARRQHYP